MALDPEVKRLLDIVAKLNPPPWESVGAVAAREMFLKSRGASGGTRPDGVVSSDRTLPGPGGPIPVRIYRPAAVPAGQALPALIYVHGGGWVIGDLESHDVTAARLSVFSGAAVMSVDYRLAPEHPFPAAFDDVVAALRWLLANGASVGIDSTRLAIGGDSAGANIAASAAILARDEGIAALRFQLLSYPVTDAVTTTESYQLFANGYGLTCASMQWFIDCYLPNEADRTDWRAAPLHAPSLNGVCPAFVVTCGYDPLRDEGRAYVRRLNDAGVRVDHVEFGGMNHGFLGSYALLHTARRAVATAALALREALIERST
jgi:acetyl esterase